MKKTEIESLAKSYLEVLEISQEDALKNAAYVFENLVIEDEAGSVYMQDTSKPVVKVIEYIENPKRTKKIEKYIQSHGKEPDWAKNEDWGMQGIMLPYLADSPEILNKTEYLAVVENSGYYNDHKQPALLISRIKKIEDFGIPTK